MPEFDLVVRNGKVATDFDVMECDVGVRDGKVAALAKDLGRGQEELDATGQLVLPGGVDSHCHIEQLSSSGVMGADDFYTGTVSAAFGGTTTVIPFAAQHRGQSLRAVVEDYHERARPKAVVDYAFHLIISDPTETVMTKELPGLIREGCTSFKVYTTSDRLKLDDFEMLEVLAVARREGALVMVHAENHDIIRWLSSRLLEGGYRAPRYLAVSHARLAESEAIHRAIRLSELIDVPLLIVHVSSVEGLDEIRRAQARGTKIYAETCTQYLFLTAEDLDLEGSRGAMFCCSPPPRDKAAQKALWQGLKDRTVQVFSSDHAPYPYDASGKLASGPDPSFEEIASGVPGLEVRMPLLFSEGVRTGRLDLSEFVALTATNAAKIYGLYPRKGTIAVGSDADLAIWDQEKEIVVCAEMLHDKVGYTPYENRKVTGWPTTVLSRGRIVVQEGELRAERGTGEFLPRAKPEAAKPAGRRVPEMDPARNFGAKLL